MAEVLDFPSEYYPSSFETADDIRDYIIDMTDSFLNESGSSLNPRHFFVEISMHELIMIASLISEKP